MVGEEERSGKAWGLAEITDERAKDILKNGEVNFVSPSIVFNEADEIDVNGNSVIEMATEVEAYPKYSRDQWSSNIDTIIDVIREFL